MDAEAEEIWRDRLRKDVDVDEIIDEKSLEEQIDKAPEYKISARRSRNLSEAKKRLKENLSSLTNTSLNDTIEDNLKNQRDFGKLKRVIIRSVEYDSLAREVGIQLAKDEINRNRFSSQADEGVTFLREFAPKTYAALRSWEVRRAEGLRELF